MEFKTIRFEEPEPGIGLLTYNRPDRLNAVSLGMLDDLYTLFHHLRENLEVRVLITTGAGRGFSSGADLKDERMMSEEGRRLFSSASIHLEAIQKKYSGVILEMRRIPQPIIAAVNGHAAGAGLCFALAADVIIAGPGAAFTPSFVNIGLSAGELGTSYFLPKMVGSARAAEIMMTGRTVGAAEAERIGLVSRLVEDESRLMNAALDTARVMLDKSALGLRMTKEVLYLNLNAPSLEAAIELENRNQSITSCAPEFFAAVENFVKKSRK